jgi:bacteriorhodopsin
MNRIPKWIWVVVCVAVLLIVLVLLKVNFSIGEGGIHIQQHLIH